MLSEAKNDVKGAYQSISMENKHSLSYRLILSNSMSKFNDRLTTCAGDCQQKMNYYLWYDKRMWYRLETYCWRNVCSLISNHRQCWLHEISPLVVCGRNFTPSISKMLIKPFPLLILTLAFLQSYFTIE